MATHSQTAVDRAVPAVDAVNGCAPGFMPLLVEHVGSAQVICTGLCAALEIDRTPAHAGNGKGDATALGKLPFEAMALPGHATCDVGIKAATADSQCRFLWPLLDVTATTLDLDRVGVCMSLAAFDSPDCATLPPRSAATPGTSDDAYDWGCQKRVPGMSADAVQFQVRAARPAEPLARHELR